MNPFRLVPLFRTRPGPAPTGWLDRMLRNRRDPDSRLVLLGDVMMNLSDWWAGFYHRLPSERDARFERDADGKLKVIHYREK